MTLALARSEPLLQADDLSVTFATAGRRVEAVRGVSLAVHRGEVLAVIGQVDTGPRHPRVDPAAQRDAAAGRRTGAACRYRTQQGSASQTRHGVSG